jgi:hypothetical protein
MAMGIPKYNEECRSIVMRYSGEWKKTVERMGRWIDFDNDYKTLNTTFMESVWWAFGQLFQKGMVYRGLKVMPYSTGCLTPLSNFEAGLDYRDVNDPASECIHFIRFDRFPSPLQSLFHSHWSTIQRPQCSHGQPHRGHCLQILASVFTPIILTSRLKTLSAIKNSSCMKTFYGRYSKTLKRRSIKNLRRTRAQI